MPTRIEMIFQFMVTLTANSNVLVNDPQQVYQLAAGLADEYLKNLG